MESKSKHVEAQNDGSTTTIRWNSSAWICMLILWVVMFGVNYSLSLKFDRLQVFEQHNVLFHADPMWRIQSFSSGNGWSDRNVIHPHLGNFFSVPNRIIARLCSLSGLYDGDEKQLRRSLALLVVPAFSAATVSIVFATLLLAGLSIAQSMLVALIGGSSFSQLIFGSIPDHFALGGFCIAAGCLLAVDILRNNGRLRWILWLGLGVLTMGVTITNIMWVGLLFGLAQLFAGKPWIPVLKSACLWLVAVGAITFATAEIARHAYVANNQMWSSKQLNAYTEDMSEEGILAIRKAPAAVANTFAPSAVGTRENEMAKLNGFGRQYRFSLEDSSGVLRIIFVVALMVTGTIGCISTGGVFRALAVASVLILGMNLTMHAICCGEYFVFSQHWLAPALVLLAGNFRLGRPYRIFGGIGLLILTLIMVPSNFLLLQEILSTLSNQVAT